MPTMGIRCAHELFDSRADRALLADPAIDLILCARGGYGVMRILDRVDYAAVRHAPKAIVGYSDVTALSLALLAQAGVVSFSGLMATAGHGFGEESLDAFSAASFFAAVGEAEGSSRVLESPRDGSPWEIHRAAATTLTGSLIPVCLSLLVALIGYEWAFQSGWERVRFAGPRTSRPVLVRNR